MRILPHARKTLCLALFCSLTACKTPSGESRFPKMPSFKGLGGLFKKKDKSGSEEGGAAGESGSGQAFLAECQSLAEGGGSISGPKGWIFKSADLSKLAKSGKANATARTKAVRAVKDYAQQLRERKIKLIIAFVPPKAVVFADQVSKKVKPPKSGPTPLRVDTHCETVAEAIDNAGVEVVDLTTDFLVNRDQDGGLFTPAGDTMTPAGARLAAERIARVVGMKGAAGLVAKDEIVAPGEVNEKGKPLSLPVRQIFNKAGTGPVPLGSGGSPVVMLSDATGTAWARERSSLAEQLSFELQSPVTLLEAAEARNAPRRRILRESTSERNPLRNAKAVVWVMESTALTSAEWEVLPLQLDLRPIEPGVSTN